MVDNVDPCCLYSCVCFDVYFVYAVPLMSVQQKTMLTQRPLIRTPRFPFPLSVDVPAQCWLVRPSRLTITASWPKYRISSVRFVVVANEPAVIALC
jgi:hypothetical protein